VVQHILSCTVAAALRLETPVLLGRVAHIARWRAGQNSTTKAVAGSLAAGRAARLCRGRLAAERRAGYRPRRPHREPDGWAAFREVNLEIYIVYTSRDPFVNGISQCKLLSSNSVLQLRCAGSGWLLLLLRSSAAAGCRLEPQKVISAPFFEL